MKHFKFLRDLILLLTGCLILTTTGCQGNNASHLPPGWQIIRPIEGTLSIAIQGDIVWVGGKNGVYKLDRKSGGIITKLEHDPPLTYVKALMIDRSGLLLIGHFNGLTSYDGANFKTYTKADGLPDNRVNALFQESDGRLWVGTWGGAAVLDNGKWNTLTKADGLINDMVNMIIKDRTGGMWFCSLDAPAGGISYFKDGKWQLFSTANGLPHNDVTSLFQDASGDVWAGTGLLYRGGAVRFVYTGQGWVIQQVLGTKDGLAGEKVRSIFQDMDGTMWFGSEYDGMTRFDRGIWRVFSEKDGLSGTEVSCMVQDMDGSIWFGTNNGVTRLTYSAVKALQ
jgi:ligand-binding sensor domain-containing protein